MNKLLVVFLIANVLASNAVFLKKTSTTTVNHLRNIQESEFGKRILDTIALQMNNKSPLSDVAKMLNDILANLKAQQVEANATIAQQRTEAEQIHNKLVGIQTACQANADDAAEQIGVLKSEIKALETKIKQLGNQLAILAARDNGLDVARAQDKKDYENRQAQGPGVIAALDVIISKLQTITPTSVDGAFVELAKIGKTNPIAALLQVAATFSEATLNSVVSKLQELSASITAAISNDEHNEAEAEAQYQKIKGEIAQTIKHVTAAKVENEATLSQKQNALALQEKRYAENTQCVADTAVKITANANKIAKQEADYAAATEGRAAEIAIIQQVIEIVAKNKEQLEDYLAANL